MPTQSQASSSDPSDQPIPKYLPPKKYVLVLSCVDARLLDDLVRFLDHDNLTNRYYHVTLPGTALGLTKRIEEDAEDECLLLQFSRWRQTFIDQVKAAVILTEGKITDIYIVQHEDCGAFRVYIGKDSTDMPSLDERRMHQEYAHALLDDIADTFFEVYNPIDKTTGKPVQEKTPNVHAFYMDLRGQVRHLESYPKNSSVVKSKKSGPKPSGKKKRKSDSN
jgi:carbonic anhydrase